MMDQEQGTTTTSIVRFVDVQVIDDGGPKVLVRLQTGARYYGFLLADASIDQRRPAHRVEQSGWYSVRRYP
jgi:hypothetical protein